jgi:autotransporter translocation and assembly factor TamB
MSVKGGVRLAQLAQPTVDLKINARDFLAIDVASYLTLRATGDVRLVGPLLQPTLTGDNVQLSRSVVYFGDLITKNVIDLEDPENAALIDLTTLQREQLRNEFSNRFLDSLRITDVHVHIGDDVWLRSAEANIQVQGDLQINKTRKVYALTGNLDTPRGTYTLRIGPINQDFVVDQGTVIYYGATNLDALLNIQAHHQVRTLDGDDFNVVATISGSILEPKVDLSSPGRNLSDRDLASYVLFGQSESQLQSGSAGTANTALAALTGAFAAELQRAAVKGALTSVTIRPGFATGISSTNSTATQIAAGLQFGRRWFVTFDAGICINQGQSFQKRNFGASLEYRISQAFRLQAAAEPVQTCATNLAADVFTTLSRYQLGFNFLWQRDY